MDVIHSIDAFEALGGRVSSAPLLVHPRIRVHGLRSGMGILGPLAMQQLGSPAFLSARLRELMSGPYDVIHFHNISLIGGPEVLSYGSALKLYTMHEYWLVCPMHVLFRNNREACTQATCLSCSLAHRRPPQLWRYSGKLAEAIAHVDLFLAPLLALTGLASGTMI